MNVLKRSHRIILSNHCLVKYQPKVCLSSNWMQRHIRDEFVKKARYQNYRARSAFKLIQMDDMHKFLKPGQIVIECGAAPGSWTQVLVERLKLAPPDSYSTGAVIALDILDFAPVPGAICLPRTDFLSTVSQAKIISALDGRKADVIVSDIAPNVSGHKDYDHERIFKIAIALIRFSIVTLKEDGTLLFKIFHGTHTERLIEDLKKIFTKVIRVKTQASREDSTELYLYAAGFKGSFKQ